MSKCPKCGKKVRSGTKFCAYCGADIAALAEAASASEQPAAANSAPEQPETTPVPEQPAAANPTPEQPETASVPEQPAAANPTSEQPETAKTATIPKQAAAVASAPEQPAATKTASGMPVTEPSILTGKRALPKKAILIGGGAIVAVIAVILIAVMAIGGGSTGEYALYLKDDALFGMPLSKDEPWEISEKLFDGDEVENSELATEGAEVVKNYITRSKDGKLLFYPDRSSPDDTGVTLYYRELKKQDAEPERIDSEVTTYAVNDAGNYVTYLKGSDGTLYRHDLSDKEKLASDVIGFDVTADGKKICWLDKEQGLYLWTQGGDKEKISGDVSAVVDISEDLSTIYYIKNESLYKCSGLESEKVASDVAGVSAIYSTGEVYYIRTKQTEVKVMDYVDDDKAAEDSTIVRVSYPSRYRYSDPTQYAAAKAAYDAYTAKQKRDRIRKSLQSETIKRTQYSFYYYNGKEETLVADMILDPNVVVAKDNAVAVIGVCKQGEAGKTKISEISSAADFKKQVQAALSLEVDWQVVSAGVLSSLDHAGAADFRIDDAGKNILFIDDKINEKNTGTLYHAAIADGKPGEAEVYDDDVSNARFAGSDIVYMKDFDLSTHTGDLYLNKTLVEYDAFLDQYDENNKTLYYYTDRKNNADGYGKGTLYTYKDGKSTKVADEISRYSVVGDQILCLYDYSLKHFNGTLGVFKKGEMQKIDDDVVAIIALDTDSKIKGEDRELAVRDNTSGGSAKSGNTSGFSSGRASPANDDVTTGSYDSEAYEEYLQYLMDMYS